MRFAVEYCCSLGAAARGRSERYHHWVQDTIQKVEREI